MGVLPAAIIESPIFGSGVGFPVFDSDLLLIEVAIDY